MQDIAAKTKPDPKGVGKDHNQSGNKFDVVGLLSLLFENKWLIGLLTTGCLLAGILFAYLQTPAYQSDAMVQVDAYSQQLTVLEEGEQRLKNEIPILSEIEMVTSRMVLGEVIKNLKLDIVAKPRYFPIFGEALARSHKNSGTPNIAKPFWGLTQYGWGGEAITVDQFVVPENLYDKQFTITAGIGGAYQLSLDGELVLTGKVGVEANTPYKNYQVISLLVSEFISQPGTEFTLTKLSGNRAFEELRNHFQASEKPKLSRILGLTYEASSPEAASKTLNEITRIFVRQSIDKKSAETQKTLDFLETQMPVLKAQLTKSAETLNQYMARKGSVDLNTETQSLLQVVVKTESEITLLQQKRDELRQGFTESHPKILAVDQQIGRLKNQIKSINRKIEDLPKTQQEFLKLSRDLKVDTELYTTLLNNAQKLRVAKSGTVGDVRVIDLASSPKRPIKPKKLLIVIGSLFFGLISSFGLAFLRSTVNHGVTDPGIVEKELYVPVYATIPHSNTQEKIAKKIKKIIKPEDYDPELLILRDKEDTAVESLRSLRTTLHFVLADSANNTIMITSPSPGDGKTFVSINLAAVFADAGKKVLLIDGDIRKGYINKALGVSREHGLADLIASTSPGWPPMLEKAIHRIPMANMDFISTGMIPQNPSELLMHDRFAELITTLSKSYDHVIIDSPPILAVTDAAIIGQLASTTLMVVKSGRHPVRELELSVKCLSQAGVRLKGVVFNDIIDLPSTLGYGYNKYASQYIGKKSLEVA